jgi:hypothetical protein
VSEIAANHAAVEKRVVRMMPADPSLSGAAPRGVPIAMLFSMLPLIPIRPAATPCANRSERYAYNRCVDRGGSDCDDLLHR